METDSFFMKVISESGIVLKIDEIGSNFLTQEQALVVREIKKIIEYHMTYPDNIQEVIEGLKNICEDETCFRKVLLPTILKKQTSDSEIYENFENRVRQDSIIRIFLCVECLQPEIIKFLTENIKIEASKQTEDTSLLRLLLNPLKYLSFIENKTELTEKLLDTIESGYYVSQLEIINALPDIVPDNEHDKIANTLCKVMESKPILTAVVVDCLNSLELSSDTKSRIQNNILNLIISEPSAESFSIFFEFLVTDSSLQTLSNIVSTTRNSLDSIMSSNKGNKTILISNKFLIIKRLKNLILSVKSLRQAITQVISSIKVHSDHLPIDLLFLILLYETSSLIGRNNKAIIKAILKKKIKTGLFRTTLLEKLLDGNYLASEIVKEYLDTILEISTDLLQHPKDESIFNFTTTLYNLIFNYKELIVKQKQDVINSLIMMWGANKQDYVSAALNILLNFSAQNHSSLKEHILRLMGLLEYLDSLNLKNVNKLFDLLCSLTCGENSDFSSGFKDELHMLIRKMLSSNIKKLKTQGIVSATMMIKHVAITSADQSDIQINGENGEESSSITDLPSGAPKEAAQMLQLISRNTLNNFDYLGLFYDQLALLLMTTNNLDKHFLAWVFDTMTNDFRQIYVTDFIPQPMNDIIFSIQYSLNSSDEVEVPIAVNIAGLTLKPSSVVSIMTLSPLFRLVRFLHNHDLTTIDALLGCGVIMPEVNCIEEFDSYQIKLIANCIFHCINWFREIISAFVKQKSRQLKYRTLTRVSNIIEMEEKLDDYLALIPDHNLPKSYFDSIQETQSDTQKSKTFKQPKKKQKTAPITNLNDTNTVVSSVQTQVKSTTCKPSKFVTKIKRTIQFRELDTDIILLLRYSLKLEDFNSSGTIILTQQPNLSVQQFNFIVKDVARQAKVITQRTVSDFSHFKVVSSENFITDCIKVLSTVMKNFQMISTSIAQEIEKNDNVVDSAEMFSSTMKDLRSSFGNVLELVAILLNWSEFQNPKNDTLLMNCIKALLKNSSETENSEETILELSKVIARYSKQCLCLSSGIHLINILKALYSIKPENDIKKRSASVSEKLLTKRWYNLNRCKETGMIANSHVDTLVKTFLDGIDVETLQDFAANLSEEVTNLNRKEDYLPTFQTIDKSNFFILFRGINDALLEGVKSGYVGLTTNEHLNLWKNVTLIMQQMMTIVQSQETKINLRTFLKKSIDVLKIFISQGLPILEIALRSQTDDVLDILKNIQKTTRFLHRLCCTTKLTKDMSLVSYIPLFRMTQETLLLRVKTALTANNCAAAFWMGTLKNKDLHGEDILSQISVTTEENVSNNGDADDELPAEESGDEMLADSDDENDSSTC